MLRFTFSCSFIRYCIPASNDPLSPTVMKFFEEKTANGQPNVLLCYVSSTAYLGPSFIVPVFAVITKTDTLQCKIHSGPCETQKKDMSPIDSAKKSVCPCETAKLEGDRRLLNGTRHSPAGIVCFRGKW